MALYEQLAQPEDTYFLDKTPRYGFVASEIHEAFAEAKFVYLWRNLLDNVASMTVTSGSWSQRRLDLYPVIPRLIVAQVIHRDCALVVKFEDLVASPDEVLKEVCDYLTMANEPQMWPSPGTSQLVGTLGDRTGLERYGMSVEDSREQWKNVVTDACRRKWSQRYPDRLGPRRLAQMGYNYDSLKEALSALEGGSTTQAFWHLASDTISSARAISMTEAWGKRLRSNLGDLGNLPPLN